jgi:hypothetical protein
MITLLPAAASHSDRRSRSHPDCRATNGAVGQFSACESGAERLAQGLETRCPIDSIAFEAIALEGALPA